MRDIVICEPVRTPVGAYLGALRDLTAAELASTAIRGLLDRTGIDPEVVGDVVLGQCYPNGEAPAIGRVAALDAGLPVTVPGLQIDRRCGSGLQAVVDAALRVHAGLVDVAIAGGAESMSQAEHYVLGARRGLRHDAKLYDRLARGRVTAGGQLHTVPGGMLETAENLRREFAIGRREQDAFALTSHQKAVAAQDAVFNQEIIPVSLRAGKGTVAAVTRDEHPRPDTSLAALAALQPIRRAVDPEATVTAGNAAGQNDGAAVCLVTTRRRAEQLGVRPLAAIAAVGVSGVEPARMGIGPVPATDVALGRLGLSLDDMDLIELNEAFAAQALAVLRVWEVSPRDERVNVHGSGISLGHPVGATGARILATMLRELDRREGRFALEAICTGGGQGIAVVFERIVA